jgi:dissimilatory sulfite reductase (desulfoviridin) alpha/beta subunit
MANDSFRQGRPVEGDVYEAVKRDLAKLPEEIRESGLAASALALAKELDGMNSATSKAMCSKALIDTWAAIRELAPKEEKKDGLDELKERRRRRQALREARAED